MTSLKCSAHNCCYNKNSLCSRDPSVSRCRCSLCGRHRLWKLPWPGECAVKNSADPYCGCETINIDCKAHNCTYNEHCKCTAASINVSGDNAHRCCDTKCDTFSCECWYPEQKSCSHTEQTFLFLLIRKSKRSGSVPDGVSAGSYPVHFIICS